MTKLKRPSHNTAAQDAPKKNKSTSYIDPRETVGGYPVPQSKTPNTTRVGDKDAATLIEEKKQKQQDAERLYKELQEQGTAAYKKELAQKAEEQHKQPQEPQKVRGGSKTPTEGKKSAQGAAGTSTAMSDQTELALSIPEIVRPELSLSTYADFIFCSPYAPNVREERVKRWNHKHEDGDVSLASIRVIPALGHKTPTITTYQIWIALISIWEKRGKPITGIIMFSSREVAAELGKKWSGALGKQIRRELEILKRTSFVWKWSFRVIDEDTNPGSRRKFKKIARTDEMNILERSSYIESAERRRGEKFTPLHRIQFDESILKNLLSGVTKPLNAHTFLSIQNSAAAVLYNHLDIIMANKSIYRRKGSTLLRELNLTGARYRKESNLKIRLEELRDALDGKSITRGRLSITIEETSDGTDFYFITRRVPNPTNKKPKRIPKKSVHSPEIHTELLEEILHLVDVSGPDAKDWNVFNAYVKIYTEPVLRFAISEFKADIKPENPHKRKIFTRILHRSAHRHGFDWHKPEACKGGGKCEFHPKNDLFK